jgi:pimeloyl-ACP methyl ester carboxylesterase
MPTATVNGVRLFYTLTGDGAPLALVHGSWGESVAWDQVLPACAQRFRVLTYDRRGHSRSERPPTQGSAEEDTADLAALIAHLDLGPTHIVGNSFGASVALRLAVQHPELVRSVAAHEPPLLGLLVDDPDHGPAVREVFGRVGAVVERLEAGDTEGGCRLFIETVGVGPGAWEHTPAEVRQVMVANAPTFLDETRDPEALTIDLNALAAVACPVLLTHGDQSLPFYALIVSRLAEALPRAQLRVIAGAGHLPHRSHPAEYVAVITAFIAAGNGAGPE